MKVSQVKHLPRVGQPHPRATRPWRHQKRGGEGGGSGTQKFVYQKWADQIFPTVHFVVSHDVLVEVVLLLSGCHPLALGRWRRCTGYVYQRFHLRLRLAHLRRPLGDQVSAPHGISHYGRSDSPPPRFVEGLVLTPGGYTCEAASLGATSDSAAVPKGYRKWNTVAGI